MDKVLHFIEEMYVAPVSARELEILSFGDQLFQNGAGSGESFMELRLRATSARWPRPKAWARGKTARAADGSERAAGQAAGRRGAGPGQAAARRGAGEGARAAQQAGLEP